MNQILVTKKLYITPELKRKKKIYKFDFILSVFLVVILISIYVYAEYDRNKSEEVSQDILSSTEFADDTTVTEDVLVVVLNETTETEEVKEVEQKDKSTPSQHVASSGEKYTTIGEINIPKINVNYPIISTWSDSLLKIAPCKFWGPEINEVGNFCIVGHNYRNFKFFSKVPKLVVDDIIEIKDLTGRTIQYKVYDKYTVEPEDVSCTSQLTNGRKEITIITCTDDSKLRVIVKAKEVK